MAKKKIIPIPKNANDSTRAYLTEYNKSVNTGVANRDVVTNAGKRSAAAKQKAATIAAVSAQPSRAAGSAAAGRTKNNIATSTANVAKRRRSGAIADNTKLSTKAKLKVAAGKVKKAATSANFKKYAVTKPNDAFDKYLGNPIKSKLDKAKTSIFASAKNAVNSAKNSRSAAQVSAAKENIMKAIKASATARKGRKLVRGRGVTGIRAGIRNAAITARGASRFAGRGRR